MAELGQTIGLRYLIFGAAALTFHGLARSTDDVDVWIAPEAENLEKLRWVFEQMGYHKDDIRIQTNDPLLPQFWQVAGPMDVLTVVHRQFDFEICFERKKLMDLDGLLVPVLHLLDVRDLKIRARRDKDLRDVILIDNYLREHNLPFQWE